MDSSKLIQRDKECVFTKKRKQKTNKKNQEKTFNIKSAFASAPDHKSFANMTVSYAETR